MPHRGWKLRIEDILQAIGKIQRYTEGMTFDAFSADEEKVDAVARNLEIVGEASRYVPAEIQVRYPRLPWAQMRGMRNAVAHGYFAVDTSVLWDTIQQDLPPLVPALREILEREP